VVSNDYASKCSGGPCWSNPPVLIFDIRTLCCPGLSARVPECQQIKNDGLDQYGAERFGRQFLLESEKYGTEVLKTPGIRSSITAVLRGVVYSFNNALKQLNGKEQSRHIHPQLRRLSLEIFSHTHTHQPN